MKFYAKLAVLAIAATSTACSGSSPSGGLPGPAATQTVQQSGAATATFTLTIPRSAASAARLREANRARHYVSFGTQGLALTVYPAGGSPATGTVTDYDLSASSKLCPSDGSEGNGEQQCTIAIAAPIGSDTFQASTYTTTPAQGFASQGLLSTGTTTATIVAAQTNAIAMVLQQVVSSVTFGPPRGILAAHQAAIVPTAVFVLDAAGDSQPSGDTTPFARPVELTFKEFNSTGQINHTSYSVNRGFPVAFVTLTNASDAGAVTVNYDGQAPLGYYATLYATIPSISNTPVGSGLVNPVFLIGSSAAYNGTGINFTAAGQSVTITTDLGDLGDPAYPVTLESFATVGCPMVASVTPLTSGSFPSFTVTALANSGACYVGIEYDQNYSIGIGSGGEGLPFNILVSING